MQQNSQSNKIELGPTTAQYNESIFIRSVFAAQWKAYSTKVA